MARTSTLRASDADREAVAAKLHQAAVEGRLDAEELEERLDLALRARTYGDLRRLVADLPAARPPRSFARTTFSVAVRVAVILAVAAVALAVLAATAMWWLAWVLVWMVLSGRRYGTARLRSNADRTSIGCFTMPNCRSHAAHFSRTSWRSWP